MDNNEKKTSFNEALEYLVESPNINNGTLSISEIKASLDGIIDDDNMYHLVYDYFSKKNINVEGYVSEVQTADIYSEHTTDMYEHDEDLTRSVNPSNINVGTGTSNKTTDTKEHNIVEMYLNDINSAKVFSELEELELLQKYLSEHMNKDIVNLLTEANLKLVPPIADEFTNKGVLYGDLLQEGNLGLIEGIMTFEDKADLNIFHEHLSTIIRSAMNDAILEQNTSSRIGSHAADRANELDRASVHLSKEFDRTPTLEELAKYLSLPEDEVEQIMKMSLNALTVNEDIEE